VPGVDPRVDIALELEQRDAGIAERLELLARLAADVGRIRTRAAELSAFFEQLPGERDHVAATAADADAQLAQARTDLAAAEAAVTRARGDDARAAAERERAGAEASVSAGEERLAWTRALGEELESEAERAEAEAGMVARAAAAATAELRAESRVNAVAAPGAALPDLVEWAARAQAALLVARSGLDAERERIFREANELGAAVLGEPLQAANVSLVRRRLEDLLGARGDS